jgi:hypothetical protein
LSSARRLVAQALGIAVFAVVGYLLATVGVSVLVPPWVVVTFLDNGDGDLQLNLRKNFRVNSISSVELRVDSGKECIWKQGFDAQTGSAAQHTFLLPKGREGENIVSRMVEAGERFDVLVAYQYDVFISPCGGLKTFHFIRRNDGKVSNLGEE